MLFGEKLQVFLSFPIGGGHTRGGVYGEFAFQPLVPSSMWGFSLFTLCVGVTLLVWGGVFVFCFLFSEEIVPYVTVVTGRGEFRIFLCCHLEMKPLLCLRTHVIRLGLPGQSTVVSLLQCQMISNFNPFCHGLQHIHKF